MTAPRFEWSSATDQADWIGPLLPPLGVSRVGSLIPTGFAAYARLLHPAISVGGNVVRWSEIATWSGTALVRGSQFHDIALPRHTPSGPPPWEDPPVRLALPEPDATTLVTLLRSHTSTPDACWFCWDTAHPLPGEPDEDPGTAKGPAPQPSASGRSLPRAYSAATGEPITPDPLVDSGAEPGWSPAPTREPTGPLVWLPGRQYRLATGPVEGVLDMSERTPNLFWPADRSWFVSTDIDLAETYLAGPDALIEAVFSAPTLETLPTHPDDTLTTHLADWLDEMVDTAVTELLTHGQASITTSRGTLHATLQPGELCIREGNNRSHSWSSMPSNAATEALRSRARGELTFRLTELAEG